MERPHSEGRTEEQASLRRNLREARARVEAKVAALRTVDAELEALSAERAKFALLETACSALYELETLGAGVLFWGSPAAPGASEQLRRARSRVDEFEKQLALVEERRHLLLEEIEREQDGADLVAGEILDAERVADEQKREWQVEREVEGFPLQVGVMPWARGQEDDRRFRRIVWLALLVSLVLGLVLPRIEIPLPERWEILEDQERLTQLVPQSLPTPPVVMPEAKPIEPEPVDETLPSEALADAPLAGDEAQQESDPAPAARPNTGNAAGPGTGSKGLLAFRDSFAGIASTNAPVAQLGSNAQIHDPTATSDGLPQRSMVTSNAPGSSGGINVAALSRGTGGGTGKELSGVAVARATSSLGTGTGGGGGGGNGTGSGRKVGGSATAGRTDEEIQIVFDRHKAALYRLYNRELRQNPTLKGQIVLRLTIQPDGTVSLCEVKSTDMKAPALAAQVVERVKSFDFGAKAGIPAVTIVYPIDFLPAT